MKNSFQVDFPDASPESVQFLGNEVLSLQIRCALFETMIDDLYKALDPDFVVNLPAVQKKAGTQAARLLQQMRTRWLHYQETGDLLPPEELVH